MIWLALHTVGYLATTVIGLCAIGLAVEHWPKAKHKRTLERIAQLEMETGVGLDWGREFFDKRKPVRDGRGNHLCWLCHKKFSPYGMASSPLFMSMRPMPKPRPREFQAHLCASCEAKTHAQVESL